MHYRIDGLVIKTENAAKPVNQQSHFVIEWIHSLPKSSVVLDFGCGKFRYTIPLSKRVNRVYAVDSVFQIQRTQTINNKKSTLAEYASKYLSNVKVCDVQGSHWQIPRYDFVLCANVLSAIPNKRIRINILRLVYPLIKRKGKLFVCTQYRNSYFNAYADNPNARKYLDGWLISNSHGESFYGIIPPEELKSICVKAGYDIVECYSKGESAYILANT